MSIFKRLTPKKQKKPSRLLQLTEETRLVVDSIERRLNELTTAQAAKKPQETQEQNDTTEFEAFEPFDNDAEEAPE